MELERTMLPPRPQTSLGLPAQSRSLLQEDSYLAGRPAGKSPTPRASPTPPNDSRDRDRDRDRETRNFQRHQQLRLLARPRPQKSSEFRSGTYSARGASPHPSPSPSLPSAPSPFARPFSSCSQSDPFEALGGRGSPSVSEETWRRDACSKNSKPPNHSVECDLGLTRLAFDELNYHLKNEEQFTKEDHHTMGIPPHLLRMATRNQESIDGSTSSSDSESAEGKKKRAFQPRNGLNWGSEASQKSFRGQVVRPSVLVRRASRRSAIDAHEEPARPSLFASQGHQSEIGFTPTTVQDQQQVSENLRWCFRHSRADIEKRMQWVARASCGEKHRNAINVVHKESANTDTVIGKLMRLYNQINLQSAPVSRHPDVLDPWSMKEGAFAKSSEILEALEVLNFYRWLCGAPRLQLDLFRQDVVDLVLHAAVRRDNDVLNKPSTVKKLRRFSESFQEMFQSSEGRALVVTHVPSAVGAIHSMMAGLPAGVVGKKIPPRALPALGRVQLSKGTDAPAAGFLPFLKFADAQESRATAHRKTWETADSFDAFDSRASISTDLSAWMSPRMSNRSVTRSVRGTPPDNRHLLPVPPKVKRIPAPVPKDAASFAFRGEGGRRQVKAWGDTLGTAAFRRSILDPRLRRTAIRRHGARVCIWAAPVLEGEPASCDPMEGDVLGLLNMEEEMGVKAELSKKPKNTPGEDLIKLLTWRESLAANNNRNEGVFAPVELCIDRSRLDLLTTVAAVKKTKKLGHFRKAIAGLTRGAFTSQHEEAKEDPTSAFERQLREEHERDAPEGQVPLLVCFPPPGIVPIELLSDTNFMPWTICPDPLKVAPTSCCTVQVFRCSIDLAAGTAQRISGGEVPLSSCRMDCGDDGTSFCVIFVLAEQVFAGDQLEVVLTGLADRSIEGTALSDLRYFLRFEKFGPSLQDLNPLRERAAQALNFFQMNYLWGPVVGQCPENDETTNARASNLNISTMTASTSAAPKRRPPALLVTEAHFEGSRTPGRMRESSTMAGTPRGTPRRGISRAGTQERMLATANSSTSQDKRRFRSKRWDARRPPPVEVVGHPYAAGGVNRGRFIVEACKGNENLLALTIPSCIVLKCTLSAFITSQAKWEAIPRGAVLHYFEAPGQVSQSLSKISSEEPRKLRVVIQLLLPFSGHFELRFQWGYVFNNLQMCRSIRSEPTMMEHPLVISVHASPKNELIRKLLPSISHTSMGKYGFPIKHPFGDHFGVNLLGPLRYRLRIGFCRVSVFVHQLPQEARHPLEEDMDSRRSQMTTPGFDGGVGKDSFEVDSEPEGEETEGMSLEAVRLQSWETVRRTIAERTRRGAQGHLVIAAVIGNWRRVQVLQRQVLEEDPAGQGLPEEDGKRLAEVHEVVLRLTENDNGLPVQLQVFQSEAEMSSSSNFSQEAEMEAEADIMGMASPPPRWVLAEFVVDGSVPLPFDESEMSKPMQGKEDGQVLRKLL